jgi:hypothetical protein
MSVRLSSSGAILFDDQVIGGQEPATRPTGTIPFTILRHDILDHPSVLAMGASSFVLLIDFVKRWNRCSRNGKHEVGAISFTFGSCSRPMDKKTFLRSRQELVDRGFLRVVSAASGWFSWSDQWRRKDLSCDDVVRFQGHANRIKVRVNATKEMRGAADDEGAPSSDQKVGTTPDTSSDHKVGTTPDTANVEGEKLVGGGTRNSPTRGGEIPPSEGEKLVTLHNQIDYNQPTPDPEVVGGGVTLTEESDVQPGLMAALARLQETVEVETKAGHIMSAEEADEYVRRSDEEQRRLKSIEEGHHDGPRREIDRILDTPGAQTAKAAALASYAAEALGAPESQSALYGAIKDQELRKAADVVVAVIGDVRSGGGNIKSPVGLCLHRLKANN